LKDDDGPEEIIYQGGFVWPNFCISTLVLTAAGFQMGNENSWYHLYNRSRRSWQRFKANHVIAVDTTTEILIKDVNVKTCARLDQYLTNGMKGATPPNFRTNLAGERASIKAKLDLEFLELNPSIPRPSTTSKSKRARKVSRLRFPSVLTTTQPSSSCAHVNVQTTPVNRSSSSNRLLLSSPSPSSPSPFQAFSQPQGDIINLTDSESSSDRYCTPVKRRKFIPIVNSSRMAAPLISSAVQVEEKRWPSDYLVLDVVHTLHSCKPPPPRTTIAQHFYSLTGIPFKSSTYYDAWSRWDEATQEQRDSAEGSGKDTLWKDFAVRVHLLQFLGFSLPYISKHIGIHFSLQIKAGYLRLGCH
jgi:hypothetical protein